MALPPGGSALVLGVIKCVYIGVSKNRGTPKRMEFLMENPVKMDDLGVPLFLETSIYLSCDTPYIDLVHHRSTACPSIDLRRRRPSKDRRD